MIEATLGILKMPIPSDGQVVGKLQYEQTAHWACDEINLLNTQLTGADIEIKRLNEMIDEHEKLNLKLTEELKEYKDPDGWDDCVAWECFCDTSYYDLWAVRPKGETRLGYCFHMNSKEEAEGLTKLLDNRKFSSLSKDLDDMIKIAKGKLHKIIQVYCRCNHGNYCTQSEGSMCSADNCPIIEDILSDSYKPAPASTLPNLDEGEQ